jgi:hypothetical protein
MIFLVIGYYGYLRYLKKTNKKAEQLSVTKEVIFGSSKSTGTKSELSIFLIVSITLKSWLTTLVPNIIFIQDN